MYQIFSSFMANGMIFGTKEFLETEYTTEGKLSSAIIDRLWESVSKRFSCTIRKAKDPAQSGFFNVVQKQRGLVRKTY